MITLRERGVYPSDSVDLTKPIQDAINYCTAENHVLYIPYGPYKIKSLNITCPIAGEINNRFESGPATFISDVDEGGRLRNNL